MRSTSRRRTCACRAACASSLRATTKSPLVPLSRRWTMPGRSGSVPPPSNSPSLSTRVGPRCEGAGWTTSPAGLSTTARSSSTWTIDNSPLIASPTPSGALYPRIGGERRTGGSLGLLLVQIRECQHDDAGGNGDVGEVEGGPAADLDIVGDRVGADTVGEVPQRAPGEQPGRDPEARSGRVTPEDEADDRQGQAREQYEAGAAAASEAEGDAGVVREG